MDEEGKKDGGKQDLSAGTELKERVTALYEKKQQLPRRYQFLFRRSQEDMLGRHISKVGEWLQDTERIVYRAIRQLRRRRRR